MSRARALRVLSLCPLAAAALALPSIAFGAPSAEPSQQSESLAKSTQEPERVPDLPEPPLEAWSPRLPSTSQPAPESEPASAPSDDASSSTMAPSEEAPATSELGISVGMPYFDDDILRPDVTVEGRYARRLLDFVVPNVGLGYRIARLDPNVVPDEVYANQLESAFLSLGLRLEAPITSWFRPFVGGAVDAAWWSTTFDTSDYCNNSSATWYPSAWRCYDKDDWAFAPVYRGQIGLLLKPEPSMAIELVAEAAIIPPADMFTRQVTLLTPSVGFAWHH